MRDEMRLLGLVCFIWRICCLDEEFGGGGGDMCVFEDG